MTDNERRADLGATAVFHAATLTNVAQVEPAETAVIDVLAYVLHFCDRLGLDPYEIAERAQFSYRGDFEDGPPAVAKCDAEEPLATLPDLPLWLGHAVSTGRS